MRITQARKEQTRRRILQVGRRLFVEQGLEATTTRELAAASGIGVGTLFNYFENKESLAVVLLEEAFEFARTDFRERLTGHEGVEEALFLHVSRSLRQLDDYRGFVGGVLETALSPFARSGQSEVGADLRANHLRVVEELLADKTASCQVVGPTIGLIPLHLYWTLFLGVLAYWSRDDSPQQEDTLAGLDESIRVFTLSLSSNPQTLLTYGARHPAATFWSYGV